MRKLVTKGTGLVLASAIMTAALLAGCGQKEEVANTETTDAVVEEPASEETSEKEVRVLEVRYDIDAAPMSYTDENGYSTGMDIELLRIVDELMPDYEFHFEGTSKDDVLSGMTAGIYDIGIHNAFYTEERGEKFLIPEENLGGSLAGLVMTKENAARFDSEGSKLLEDIVDADLKLAPQIAGDGRTYQFEQYNLNHPDKQIEFELTSDLNIFTKHLEWIVEGKYDVSIFMKGSWDKNVVPEDGGNHEYYDQVEFVPFKAIKTYPMISRINLDEAFLEEFNEALKQAKADPRTAELSNEFYGENIFEVYPFEEGR